MLLEMPTVPVLEIVELELKREDVSPLQFSSKTTSSSFGSKSAVFTIPNGRFLVIFCSFGSASQFFDCFSQFQQQFRAPDLFTLIILMLLIVWPISE